MSSVDHLCPVCKADSYLNPQLKLLVSPCYHKMCISCIDRIFTSGPAPCPICRHQLRKSNFVVQTFEDLVVEKEVQIRKKFGKYFNKRLDDFKGDKKKFNDYLEEVEDILFNLINEVDVKQTMEKIEKWRTENRELISQNIKREINEEKNIKHRLEKEKSDKLVRKELLLSHIKDDEKAKLLQQEELIRKLADPTKDVKTLVSETILQRQTLASTVFAIPDMAVDDEMDFEMDYTCDVAFEPVDHVYLDPIDVPIADSYQDSWNLKYDIVQKAGGFTPLFTATRAIHLAFSGLMEGLFRGMLSPNDSSVLSSIFTANTEFSSKQEDPIPKFSSKQEVPIPKFSSKQEVPIDLALLKEAEKTAIKQAKENNYPQALQTLNDAILPSTRYPSIFNNRANIHRFLGNSLQALRDLDNAIEYADPHCEGAVLGKVYTQRGILRLELGMEVEAERDFLVGARFGDRVARARVGDNPYAKMCGEVVREAMKKYNV